MAETAREGFFNELSNGHYEPRQTGVRNTTCPRSRSQSAASTSIRRMRSNNGHGCADLEDSNDEAGVAAGNGVGEKDNFEVAWDGDDDPMCPRRPLLMGPLSEFFGRRPIYLVSWTMFLIWIIPSAVAKNAETMIVVRFFDGFAGSSFLSVAGGTVSDIFKKDAIQGPMTIISLSPFIGPSLGPLLGGFVNSYTHWRWTYYFLLIWAAIMLALIVFFAPETYHPIKLREKARSLRKETGDERWRAPMEKSEKSIARTVGYSLLRPFQLLIFEPMCLALDIFSAILLGILYLFFGAFGVVFGNAYGFNLWQTGLAFLGIFTGMITASATSPVWRKVHSRLVAGNNGISEPEFHLPPAVAGAVLVPIGLFWFAWSSYPWVHWMVPIVGSGVFGMGTLLVFTGIFTFLVDAYPLYAASALAANAFTRCAFAVGVDIACISHSRNDAVPLAILPVWQTTEGKQQVCNITSNVVRY
ncbi:hypothetical protein TruAng_003428 [Truncatella angustata]|nr:hypothetical protein TruAng_003428 [Truncatella angustata]